MARICATILDGVAAAVMVQGFRSIKTLPIDAVMRNQYGGHAQYLTIQGLALSCVCMTLGLANNLLPGLTALNFAKRCLMMVAMPISVVISVIYWSLITFFPKLIMPDFSAGASSASAEIFRLPLSIDLALHAAPAVCMILDFFLFERKYNQQEARVVAPIAAVAFASWYAVWVEHCAKMNDGIFPYPFLTDNTQPIRIGIYIGATIMAFGSFRLINSLHH